MISNVKNRLLLIVNCAGNNGAPVFAVDVCRILKKTGYEVTVWAMRGGRIEGEFSDFAKLEIVDFYSENKTLPERIKNFDGAIVFTIQTYLFYEECKKCIPTIWYIHEARNLMEYFQNSRCRTIFNNAGNIVVVSEYAQQAVLDITGKKSEVLHNFVPDHNGGVICLREKDGIIKFLIAGSMNHRKAFDMVFDTFLALDEVNKDKCELWFCGEQSTSSDYVKEQLGKVENNPIFVNAGEISRNQLMNLYKEVDVVIVPSRDESCSLVVLESLMMGKPVIISDSVGASYLVNDANGWVFETDNQFQLGDIITKIVNGAVDFEKMGEYGRKAYLDGATEQIYTQKLLKIVDEKIYQNSLWNLIIRIKGKWQKHYNDHFLSPFTKIHIPRNSRIVLYGAGKYGIAWKTILEKSHYVRLVAWVDKFVKGEGIIDISELDNLKFDYILISIVKSEVVEEVRNELSKYVDEGKILIQAECSDELLGW